MFDPFSYYDIILLYLFFSSPLSLQADFLHVLTFAFFVALNTFRIFKFFFEPILVYTFDSLAFASEFISAYYIIIRFRMRFFVYCFC